MKMKILPLNATAPSILFCISSAVFISYSSIDLWAISHLSSVIDGDFLDLPNFILLCFFILLYHRFRGIYRKILIGSSKWLILATSLDPDKHNLLELYSRRWQIELLFKRSKSIFHFRRLRHSSLGYTLSLSRAWSAVIRLASFAASFFQIPFFDFFSLFASCFA